jgi:hypothetical protein
VIPGFADLSRAAAPTSYRTASAGSRGRRVRRRRRMPGERPGRRIAVARRGFPTTRGLFCGPCGETRSGVSALIAGEPSGFNSAPLFCRVVPPSHCSSGFSTYSHSMPCGNGPLIPRTADGFAAAIRDVEGDVSAGGPTSRCSPSGGRCERAGSHTAGGGYPSVWLNWRGDQGLQDAGSTGSASLSTAENCWTSQSW